MYTPAEVAKVKSLYQNLVELNLIRIEELDGFGEPVAQYTAEARRQLIKAITGCENFPWPCVIENASLHTTASYIPELRRVFRGVFNKAAVMDLFWQSMEHEISEAAMLELTESLFPKAELNSMLKDHHEYLDMVQDNVRRGLLLAEEMDDSAERVRDMEHAA
jgi:hypothetical protein